MKDFIRSLLLNKWLNNIYNRLVFRINRIDYSEFPQINGRIRIVCIGKIRIGEKNQFNSGSFYNPIGGDTILRLIVPTENSFLSIGNNVGISNSTIVCHDSVIIEDNVLIGGNCKIYDTDFHSIQTNDRLQAFNDISFDANAKTAPIQIKKGAWIGGHCIILKGVTIGVNSVIGAGSVVSKDIPDNEIWGGNPIKFIRQL